MKMLETERLLLRPFDLDDLAAIHREVYSDPEVCHFYCRDTRTLDHVERWLHYRRYQAQTEDFGLLAVVVKDSSAVIGLCGIQPYVADWVVLASTPEPWRRFPSFECELTYAFGQAHWGKGYAYEASRAMIDYAFRDVKLRRLVTGCDPENHRARKLQDRLGMRQEPNLHPDWLGTTEGVLDNDQL